MEDALKVVEEALWMVAKDAVAEKYNFKNWGEFINASYSWDKRPDLDKYYFEAAMMVAHELSEALANECVIKDREFLENHLSEFSDLYLDLQKHPLPYPEKK